MLLIGTILESEGTKTPTNNDNPGPYDIWNDKITLQSKALIGPVFVGAAPKRVVP